MGFRGGERERCTPYAYAVLGRRQRRRVARPECELAASARAVVRCLVLGRWTVVLLELVQSSCCSSPGLQPTPALRPRLGSKLDLVEPKFYFIFVLI